MEQLSLAEVVPRVTSIQERGNAAIVVTVLDDRSGLAIPPSSRLVVSDDGTVHGSLHAEVDQTMIEHALRSLDRKRSIVQSYDRGPDGIRLIGIHGGSLDIFFDVLPRRPKLVVVGAGHIAVPLAKLATLLDFEVIVLDDRPEYASVERFPSASEIRVGTYRETLAQVLVDSDTYIVLVTRGHVHDQACLEQVLDSNAPYIGMIGSKRRVRTVLSHVKATHDNVEGFQRVYAPVGLDIGSQTPAEIALAVMAEIVNQRRGGKAPSLRLGEPGGA